MLRLSRLIKKYPGTRFSFLIDNPENLLPISKIFEADHLTAFLYIDINVGMNRTGILPQNAIALFREIQKMNCVHLLGLHGYDGHIKEPDPEKRANLCLLAFEPVLTLKKDLEKLVGQPLTLVAGGTPTCFIHAAAGDRECSPGTFIFWDKGYSDQLPEQPFEWAATVLCRIVSIPDRDKICVDLGYKSLASENPQPRVYFPDIPDAIPIGHSEEHLVLRVPDSRIFHCGDVIYGIPWHICPTVALYEKAFIIEKRLLIDSWKIIARDREITI